MGIRCIQSIDMNALLVHPACVVSVTLTALRTEPTRRDPNAKDSFLINISGRLFMVNQNSNNNQVSVVVIKLNYIYRLYIINNISVKSERKAA